MMYLLETMTNYARHVVWHIREWKKLQLQMAFTVEDMDNPVTRQSYNEALKDIEKEYRSELNEVDSL